MGMGAGRREAPRPAQDSLKPGLGGPRLRGGARTVNLSLGGSSSSLWRELRSEGSTARRGDETVGSRSRCQARSPGSTSPWAGSLHRAEPSAVGSSLWLLGRRADFPVCGRELWAGWFSWNVFTMLNGT